MVTTTATLMDAIEIVPTEDEHVLGFQRCVDAVARERRYLTFLEGPPLEMARAFVRHVVATGGVHVVALTPAGSPGAVATVVGWCDIVRDTRAGFTHGGRLGMGLLPPYRGRGIGARLALAALERAAAQGLDRIELEVYASNTRAIALYERLGFVCEGVKRAARRLDGQVDNNVLMARIGGPTPDDGETRAQAI